MLWGLKRPMSFEKRRAANRKQFTVKQMIIVKIAVGWLPHHNCSVNVFLCEVYI